MIEGKEEIPMLQTLPLAYERLTFLFWLGTFCLQNYIYS